MSFRTRLTSFFVVIVIAPMLAIGVLAFRLIGDSQRGKADARAAGLSAAASSVYDAAQARAQAVATALAHQVELSKAAATGHDTGARARLTHLATQAGLVRVVLTIGSGTPPLVDVGNGQPGPTPPRAAMAQPPTRRPPPPTELS